MNSVLVKARSWVILSLVTSLPAKKPKSAPIPAALKSDVIPDTKGRVL